MVIQSGYTGPRRSLVQRAIAAAGLDSGAFEEVEADKTANAQAAAVVVVSAIAQAVAGRHGLLGIPLSICGALFGWVIWSVVAYFVGVTVFKGTATVGELLRTLGFAQAPGVFYALGVIPLVRWFVAPVVAVWILIAGVIALRQALDIDTWKAVVTGLIGYLLLLIPMLLFYGALGLLLH
jgi:hypothetical protein